jgi:hypothetical protein
MVWDMATGEFNISLADNSLTNWFSWVQIATNIPTSPYPFFTPYAKVKSVAAVQRFQSFCTHFWFSR